MERPAHVYDVVVIGADSALEQVDGEAIIIGDKAIKLFGERDKKARYRNTSKIKTSYVKKAVVNIHT